LEALLGVSSEALLNEMALAKKERVPFRHIFVKRNITRAELTLVEEYSPALPGVFTVVRPQRRYVHGSTAGQILGYLNEIGEDELKRQSPDTDYKMGDLIGRRGLEAQYEALLRGTDGQLCVSRYAYGAPQLQYDGQDDAYTVVDEVGRELETKFRVEPIPGKPLYVTLDIGLQQKAERLLDGTVGAIVVVNARNGEVLALASSPGYDPSVFVNGTPDERAAALFGEAKPMRHRAFQEVYPPGSVFKVMLAIAALEEGVIDEHTTFHCNGLFRLSPNGHAWRCWRIDYGGHGDVSVVDALAFSCDVFFYNVGRLLGVDSMKKWAQQLGLGETTGIDLPGEAHGIVPSREWKEQVARKLHPDDPSEWQWYPGETINLSIGQGSTATTPLQNAVLMAAVINGGRRIRPHLDLESPEEPGEPFISARTLEIVHRGMRKCVEKQDYPRGTGRLAFIPGTTVLGKTGTAQVVGREHYEDYEDEEDIPEELRDHALFVAGVPDREPPIAVSVLIEHGLHGSDAAAPVAKEIIEYFYRNRAGATALASRAGQP
ncbi:MAG: penicillin-binding protein 2, partial [Candidatus Hydrogenedentes bacterium]|nr:penicillin-binding protein 2 [Candidatus Hydrogenedentota bacterium]